MALIKTYIVMRDRCVLPVNAGVAPFERGERVLRYYLLRFFLRNYAPERYGSSDCDWLCALLTGQQQHIIFYANKEKKIPTGNLAFETNAFEFQNL